MITAPLRRVPRRGNVSAADLRYRGTADERHGAAHLLGQQAYRVVDPRFSPGAVSILVLMEDSHRRLRPSA